METLRARLEAAEDRAFQGRSEELARLIALLGDPRRLPRLVSVHGPPGIGKTAFTMALARRCERAGIARAVVIDSRDVAHDLASLVGAVASRCPWPPPADGRPVLLAFDTYEEMGDIEAEIRERFAAALSGPVLLLLVGRRRASGFLDLASWRPFVDEVELGGLPAEASRQVARQHGLADEGTVERVLAFAQGNPLLLGMAADVVAADPAADLMGWSTFPATAHALMARMTQDIRDRPLKALLEAACVVRTFNEELLSRMLERDVSADFPRLCDLSVVRITATGVRVHDVVRRSLAADLRWRAPLRHRQLRNRGYAYLKSAVAHGRASPTQVEELAFLAGEASAAASFFAPREQSLAVRSAEPGEASALLDLCRTGVTNLGTSPERRAMEVVNDLPAGSDWFLLAMEGERPVGFGYTLPLHSRTLAVLAAIREPFFRRLPEEEVKEIRSASEASPPAFLNTGSTFLPAHPQAEAALRSAAFARRNSHAPSAKRSHFLITQGSPFERSAAAAGMRRRLTGIRLPGSEQLFDEWLLDYGQWGLTSWLEAALGIESAPPPVPFDELVPLVKAAFRNLYREGELAASPLTNLRATRARGEDPAPNLRALLIDTVRELASSEPLRAREAAALLRAYYVRRVGTHDVVAERLGLTRTTFYRRLQQGLLLVARRLMVDEVAGPDEDAMVEGRNRDSNAT